MHRLIVNPDTEDSWEIPLVNGLTSIGRGPDNDFSIEHESISNARCLVTVMDSGTTIQDLGAIAGEPKFRILDECKALPREVANELKSQSPLDSNE
jgi:pSer/pThr/pTyr-binding forkhead associated (FHA) protein